MRFLTAALVLALFPVATHAAVITDPVGDFAPGYTGNAADLDVTSFSVTYDPVGQQFLLGGTVAGIINPATAGLYAIGVNTGSGAIAPFASQGAPNVRFNQVVVLTKGGRATLGATPLIASVTGNSFAVIVSQSLLPTTGFTPSQYSWNLWPRTGLGAGTVATDFAPDNAMLAPVPEPGTWMTMLLGFGLLGGAMRRRLALRQTAHA